jgi:translocator protein
MTTNILSGLLLFTPLISGYTANMFCSVGGKNSIGDSGSKKMWSPPGIVFRIVWPCLYLSLGIVWVLMRRKHQFSTDLLLSMTTLCLLAWIVVYGCIGEIEASLYINLIVLVLALVLFGYTWKVSTALGILVTPYLAWIIFANILNYMKVLEYIE